MEPRDFNSFGSRRGNHEVMMRGTFGNIRLRNALAGGKEGNWTEHLPTGEESRASTTPRCATRPTGTPLVVLAGALYGNGSSRDWAAKGTLLLGVRAVIAKSFERIHRGNLVGMGVLPLQFLAGEGDEELGLTGREIFTITGLADLTPRQTMTVGYTCEDGSHRRVPGAGPHRRPHRAQLPPKRRDPADRAPQAQPRGIAPPIPRRRTAGAAPRLSRVPNPPNVGVGTNLLGVYQCRSEGHPGGSVRYFPQSRFSHG